MLQLFGIQALSGRTCDCSHPLWTSRTVNSTLCNFDDRIRKPNGVFVYDTLHCL